MPERNILSVTCREQFREWLTAHAVEESECWVAVKRGKPVEPDSFYYIDAGENAAVQSAQEKQPLDGAE